MLASVKRPITVAPSRRVCGGAPVIAQRMRRTRSLGRRCRVVPPPGLDPERAGSTPGGDAAPGPGARGPSHAPLTVYPVTGSFGRAQSEGASMAPSETFPMGQAEPGKPAPESGRGASTAPSQALPAGPRLPRQSRRPRVGKALDSPFPAHPTKDSIAPAKPSPGPRTRRAKLLLDEPDSSISAQPQGRTSITALSDRRRGLA